MCEPPSEEGGFLVVETIWVILRDLDSCFESYPPCLTKGLARIFYLDFYLDFSDLCVADQITEMATQTPFVSASGIWYAYFAPQEHPGDNNPHVLGLDDVETFGNATLFSDVEDGVAMTHRTIINVDTHVSAEHEVLIERTLEVQLDKAGTKLPRGQSILVAGVGNAAYQGILEEGQIVRAAVVAPGDKISVLDGYISVSATPI